ncbi:NAD(P)-binding protein [Ganoderma leucocontextum]|nr:NAD(P)-binding protein [Ganoderma leucocontextum]
MMADINIVNVLSVLGVVLAIPHIHRILDFFWFYFLRPSSVNRYLHGNGRAPYAIVTGATAGIGKATAAELLARGFNVVLHGRNEAKMQKVVEELRACTKGQADGTARDIRYFIADAAAEGGHDWAKLVEPFRDLHVTVVVHNVGGSDVTPPRIDERTEEHILSAVHLNALFSLFLTRALLPQLRRAARSGPVQVLFLGSMAADVAPPRLPIYAASKAFLETLARGLDNDELFFDAPTGVRFMYLAMHGVRSDSHDALIPPSWKAPTSARFACALVESVGCGRRRVAPYVGHAVQGWLTQSLQAFGHKVVDSRSARIAQLVMARAGKGR